MKHLFLMLAACMACGAAGAKTTKVHYRLSISSGSGPTWAVVRDVPAEAKGATVYLLDARHGRTEIPSQLDDLDGDGVFDELVFPVDMQPGERADVRVDYSTKEVAHDYKPLVNAQMWWKNPDKTLTEKSQLSSLKDDMYRKLHHHGPAFESEYAAYRIYFDKKQSIDTYGKRQPRLELRETMWYPSDEQLAAGYGHDNLRVFGTVSIGALKGWNPVKRRMEHIVDMRRREATIRAYGPLRTVVDMRVEGWNYGGREIDMTSRYILYGGGSVVKVENFIEGEGVDELELATGVMKIRDNRIRIVRDNDSYLLQTVGCDFPENDTLRWERETVGLAAWLPARQVVSQIDDAGSYLCQLRPVGGRIDYWFVMGWRKSGFLDWDDGQNDDLQTFETECVAPRTARAGSRPYAEVTVERLN
ncbi:DUF4861 family protein [uncultured Alistipes sp.]|jgi:hypothetical protein|uniref:DUF4861 family protein n=1 Tax=uncultured Alistipes sp. TaxID=538949 RepID=UPI0025CFE9D3|nr:DUF4861 family protein [uncultured Alistipes sp.]